MKSRMENTKKWVLFDGELLLLKSPRGEFNNFEYNELKMGTFDSGLLLLKSPRGEFNNLSIMS